MITWIGPPHLYHRERWIVVYLGSDPTATSLLDDVMGPQFAGAA